MREPTVLVCKVLPVMDIMCKTLQIISLSDAWSRSAMPQDPTLEPIDESVLEHGPNRGRAPTDPDKPPGNKRQAVGAVGAALLIIGVFCPLISVPIIGSMNYFHNGKGEGVIVLVIGAIALALALNRTYKAVRVAGIISLFVVAYSFYNVTAKLSQAQSDASQQLKGNQFQNIGEALMNSGQLQWGWGVLLLGAIILIVTPSLRD